MRALFMVNGEQIIYLIKKFIDDECTEFIDPDEKVSEINLKNFEQK